MLRQWMLVYICLFSSVAICAEPVTVQKTNQDIRLSNGRVTLTFNLAKGTYALSDSAGQSLLTDAGLCQEWENDYKLVVENQSDIADALGKGKQIVLRVETPHTAQPYYAEPWRLFSFTLYEGHGAVVMGFGMKMPQYYSARLMEATPLARAKLFPGKTINDQLTLNGGAGSEQTLVQPGLSRRSDNSLLLTANVSGKRWSVVWGGLCYQDFGKSAALHNGIIEMLASDPVGRLVDAGETYLPKDSFYLEITRDDPFTAMERYGQAMRLANNAKPNVYDFPVLCGWSVGAMSHLPNINNSVKLMGELDQANKCGLARYTKVGIRLEPDKYHGDSEQGWWDDAHWAKFGHLIKPYDTMAKWCAAINQRNGIPYTYFQMGMPSDDYASAFPGHMLFNDISRLGEKHRHHQPYVSYDYTDPDFQKHMKEVWARLRKDGIRGIKFDYPETAWRPEGGFEDRHSTTAAAYRKAFALCREGLGADAFIDERNLGESGRPCLDVTAGIVDTQRNWTDSNAFTPAMVTISGLRWYKNRTVFNYFPDTKVVHGCSAEIRRSMLTMIALTSGRIDLATSFSLFTPEITHDFSRIYPAYREPITARPLDAFTGIRNPQVYDLELNSDWHQIAFFNSGNKKTLISTALSGDRVSNAIGLDPKSEYYAYDFWADAFIGKLPGTARLNKTLDPLNCAMISLRKVQPNPQVLSTNRHILQGWVELANVTWNANSHQLSGTARVIGNESFKIVVANNGRKPIGVSAQNATPKLIPMESGDLTAIIIEQSMTGDTPWEIQYQ